MDLQQKVNVFSIQTPVSSSTVRHIEQQRLVTLSADLLACNEVEGVKGYLPMLFDGGGGFFGFCREEREKTRSE